MTVKTVIAAYLGKLPVVARAPNPATIKNTIAYLRAEIAGYQGMIKARAPLIQANKTAGKPLDHLVRANAAAKKKVVQFQALLADQQKRLAAVNDAPAPAPAPAPASKTGRKPPGPAHAAPKKPAAPATVVASVGNPLVPVEAKKIAQRGAKVSGRKQDGSFHVEITPSRLTMAGQRRLHAWHKGKKDVDGKFPTLYVKVAGREKPHRVSSPSGLADLMRNYCQKKPEAE